MSFVNRRISLPLSVFFLLFCPLKNAYKLSFLLHKLKRRGRSPLRQYKVHNFPTQTSSGTSCTDRALGGVLWIPSFQRHRACPVKVGNSPSLKSVFSSPPSVRDCSWGREMCPQKLRALSSPNSEPGQNLCHHQTSVLKKQHCDKSVQHVLYGPLK